MRFHLGCRAEGMAVEPGCLRGSWLCHILAFGPEDRTYPPGASVSFRAQWR